MNKHSFICRLNFRPFFGLFPIFIIISMQVGIPPGSSSQINKLAENSPLEEQEWVRLGGPIGGLGYDIRMDPRNPDVMYVTDAMSGAHKSLDGGRTWFPINEGIDMRSGPSGDLLPVFCLTIDPNNPDTIWIGLQGLGGVYRSDDGGMTWGNRSTGIDSDGLTVRGITIEPGNSNVVYIAGEVPSFRWAGRNSLGKMFDRTKGVIYKSLDGGHSWRKIWDGDNLARYIWIDPRNVKVLYVSTGIFDRESALTNVEANEPGGVGVLKSTDGGETWKVLNQDTGLTGLYVGSLFMHPTNPDVLLAGSGHDYWSHAWDQGGASISPAGVWLTGDGGESWDQVLADDFLISSVEICHSNPDIAYAAGVFNFYRSEDGGLNWHKVVPEGGGTWGPPGIVVGFPIDFQCDPRDPMRLFVNNYGGGNFLSEDGGKSWVSASQGFTGAIMRIVVVDRNNPALVYAGGRSGLFSSNDGGKIWESLAYAPANYSEILTSAISPTDPELVLNAPWDLGNLARSTDGGMSWKVIRVSDQPHSHQFLDLAFAPSDPKIVYSSLGSADCTQNRSTCDNPGDGVYVSIDAGLTWNRATDDNLDGLHVKSLAVHPLDPGIVYAGTLGKGVYKSVDGGQNWQFMGFDGRRVFAIDLQPGNPDTVLAGMKDGVYRSDDGGNTWKSSNAGLDPNAAVRSLVFDPVNPEKAWVSDLFSGVYLSGDAGRTWVPVNQGLTNRTVNDLAISGDGSTLYAATEGGGVFRLSLLSQDEFDSIAPQPTLIPTQLLEPEPTMQSSDSQEIEPQETPQAEVVEPTVKTSSLDDTPPPDGTPEPDARPSFPCLGIAILPLAMLSMVGLVRLNRQNFDQ